MPAAKRKAATAFGTKTPVCRSYEHSQPKVFAKGTGYGGSQGRGSEWHGLSIWFLEHMAGDRRHSGILVFAHSRVTSGGHSQPAGFVAGLYARRAEARA
jgi:hypothetical protein